MKNILLSPSDYHLLPFDKTALPDLEKAGFVSASVLSKSKNPLNYLLSQEPKSTKSMEWGSLVDAWWLTPESFWEQYAAVPRDSPKDLRHHRDAKKPAQATLDSIAWWDSFDVRNIGKIPVDEDTFEEVKSAARMLSLNPLAEEFRQASLKQLTLAGDSRIFGCKMKAMIDLLPASGRYTNCVVDLKTTNDVSEYGFALTIHTFEYQLKMAVYQLLAEEAGYGERNTAIIIWQNSKFPYDVHVRSVDHKDSAIGKAMAFNRLEKLRRMDPTKLSLYYDTTIQMTSLADWMRNKCL